MAVKKWRGKWVVDFIVDDKRIRRVSPVQTKRGAKAYEVVLRLELTSATPQSGAAPAAEVPTLAEFATEWMSTYVRVHSKPSGALLKDLCLSNHLVPFFGKQRLDAITQRQIEGFKAHQIDKGLKPASVNRHLSVLGRLLRCAMEWRLIGEMPTINTLPEPQADFDWLRPAEVGRLLDIARSMRPQWFVFFLLAVRTGMRKGEIYGLHWRSVDFGARRITVEHNCWRGRLGTPKNGKTRVVPMTADLVEALSAWRQHSAGEIVFPNKEGGLVSGQTTANEALSRALKKAGLRHVRFHDLRHTFASHLVLQKCSLKVVQVLMGHSSVRMTERYAHVADEQLVAAVDVLDGLGFKGEETGDQDD